MANQSARLLLIIASILIGVAVAGAIVAQVQNATSAMGEGGQTASDELQSNVEIVNDPGARGSIYDEATDELSLHVKNTGGRTLPADAEVIDLLVDGKYQTAVDVTLFEGSRWKPDTIARLTTGYDLDRNETMRVIVRVSGAEDTFVFDAVGEPDLPRAELVYTTATGTVKSISTDGTIDGYGVTAAAIGPKEIDVDGDDRLEVPFVRTNGTLAIVDANGNVQNLATGARTNGTLLAVGTWRHETSVFYVNETDGGYLYRAGVDSNPERVFADESPIEASAVAGVADYNGDGDLDLVYADPTGNVTYVDNRTAYDVGRSVGTGPGVGIGAPRDFDGASSIRVPFVDATGDVALLTAADAKTSLTGSGPANQSAVAGLDWTGNGGREVAFVDASTDTLYYVRLDGTVVQITDSNGDPVAVDPESGVA